MVAGASPSVPQTGGPVIVELPLEKIRRPLMRTRSNDQEKVKDLMDSIAQIGLQVPVCNLSFRVNIFSLLVLLFNYRLVYYSFLS